MKHHPDNILSFGHTIFGMTPSHKTCLSQKLIFYRSSIFVFIQKQNIYFTWTENQKVFYQFLQKIVVHIR